MTEQEAEQGVAYLTQFWMQLAETAELSDVALFFEVCDAEEVRERGVAGADGFYLDMNSFRVQEAGVDLPDAPEWIIYLGPTFDIARTTLWNAFQSSRPRMQALLDSWAPPDYA